MEPRFIKIKRVTLPILLVAFLLFVCLSAVVFADVQSDKEIFAKVFEEARHSVVFIRAKKPRHEIEGIEIKGKKMQGKGADALSELFPYIDLSDFPTTYVGSGVIIDKSGYILTSNDLVKDSREMEIEIGKADGSGREIYNGKIVGQDAFTGLAVIRIDPGIDLTEANIGNSSDLRIGQWMIAIGTLSGLDKTAAVGVVGGLGRTAQGTESRYHDYIATDALIGPATTGGPLLNIDGEVVAIGSAFRYQQTGVGLGIPIDDAMDVYRQLVEHGEVRRGFLGVGISDLDEVTAAAFAVPDARGVLVTLVYPDTPAKNAGIRHGDVIREIDGVAVENTRALQKAIARKKPGTEVKVTLLRKGREENLLVELVKLPESLRAVKPSRKNGNPLGLTVGEIPEDAAASVQGGVIIEKIEKGGRAEQAGLEKGDIIVEVDMRAVSNTKDYEEIVGGLASGSYVSFYILRGDATLYRAIKIPKD